MNGLRVDTLVATLGVMGEARERLARDVAPGDYDMAKRIAIVEGALREQLRTALPERVELRPAA